MCNLIGRSEAQIPARAYARACLKNVRVFKLTQNADLVKQTEGNNERRALLVMVGIPYLFD